MRSSDGARAGIAGVATVTGFRPCQVVGRTWMDLVGGSGSGRIAIVADSEAVQGPLTIFLGGSNMVEPAADGWPPRTRGASVSRCSIDARATVPIVLAAGAYLPAEHLSCGARQCA